MKKFLRVFVALLMVAIVLAGVDRSQSVTASSSSNDMLRWEVAIDLPPQTAQDLPWFRTLNTMGVSTTLREHQLVLQGSQNLEQLRATLFDALGPEVDFLGGIVEATLFVPVEGQRQVMVYLEARNTTGYIWEVVPGQGYAQEGQSSFEMRSFGAGVPARQAIRLTLSGTDQVAVRLRYQRPFAPQGTSHARLQVWLSSPTDVIDLSDPTPTVLLDSPPPPNPDAYRELDQIRTTLPSSWDWRTQGIVPAVRDQGSCGSCWAFGTVSVMESAVKKGGGPLRDLSEQFLISCNQDGWSCNGGLTATKYHYNTLGKNQTAVGAVLEVDKPYTATNGSCLEAYPHPYKASGWAFVTGSEWTMPTVAQIKTAIYTYGPVTAGVCVDSGWYSYSGGVYNPSSNQCNGYTNHQIVLVGWDDSTSSWILRNSWGSSWGEGGYMRIRWDTSGTTSRVGEGTSWVKYTPPASGFFSNFNGSATGWSAVKGPWSIYNNAYYRSAGLANKVASAKRTGTYSNFTYEARMKRSGLCTGCANRLIIRGRPGYLTTDYNWRPSYLFQYTNSGYFSVWKITSTGSAVALKGWTYSSVIVRNGWNTLKVIANGPSLKFYLNGKWVWSGYDYSIASGVVGLGFYRDAYAGTLDVDWAKLTVISADTDLPADEGPLVPGREVPGGTLNQSP